MNQYQNALDEIKKLQVEVEEINEKIANNEYLTGRLQRKFDEAPARIKEAKKAALLDAKKKKDLLTVQNEEEQSSKKLENTKLLTEALQDKKAGIAAEIAKIEESIRTAKIEALANKAPGLLKKYNEHIKKAHELSVVLKTLVGDVQHLQGSEYLRSVCLEISNLTALPFAESFEIVGKVHRVRLFDSDVNKELILNELYGE